MRATHTTSHYYHLQFYLTPPSLHRQDTHQKWPSETKTLCSNSHTLQPNCTSHPENPSSPPVFQHRNNICKVNINKTSLAYQIRYPNDTLNDEHSGAGVVVILGPLHVDPRGLLFHIHSVGQHGAYSLKGSQKALRLIITLCHVVPRSTHLSQNIICYKECIFSREVLMKKKWLVSRATCTKTRIFIQRKVNQL